MKGKQTFAKFTLSCNSLFQPLCREVFVVFVSIWSILLVQWTAVEHDSEFYSPGSPFLTCVKKRTGTEKWRGFHLTSAGLVLMPALARLRGKCLHTPSRYGLPSAYWDQLKPDFRHQAGLNLSKRVDMPLTESDSLLNLLLPFKSGFKN